jgi:hypothetical protein
VRCSPECGYLDFSGHATLANHQRGCGLVLVPCSNGCGESVVRDDLNDHIRDHCPLRLVPCRLGCGAQLRARDNPEEHEAADCPKGRVECECGAAVAKEDMGEHKASACPHRLIDCPRGCGVNLRAVDAASPAHRSVCTHESLGCLWGCEHRIHRRLMEAHKAVCEEVNVVCPGCDGRYKRRDSRAHWAACGKLPVLCVACDHLCLRDQLVDHQKVCETLHPPPPEFECGICMVEEPIDGCFQSSGCMHDHRFHFECAAHGVRIQIEQLSQQQEPVVRCPHNSGCDCTLDFHEIEGLSNRGLIERKLFDKFDRLLTYANTGITKCPGGCDYALAEVPEDLQFFQCRGNPGCKDDDGKRMLFCLFCLRAGFENPECRHAVDVPCDDHRAQIRAKADDPNDSTGRYLARRVKKCPGCSKMVVKTPDPEGVHNCMKMFHEFGDGPAACTVRPTPDRPNGGTKFCWWCLADQFVIDKNDLSFHRRECLYWCASAEDKPGRPDSTCTRAANGDLGELQNYHCMCRHDCDCSAGVRINNECRCGRDVDGNPMPTNECRCGKHQITCLQCDKTFCRLCGREPHEGYKCIEDRLPGDPDPDAPDAE